MSPPAVRRSPGTIPLMLAATAPPRPNPPFPMVRRRTTLATTGSSHRGSPTGHTRPSRQVGGPVAVDATRTRVAHGDGRRRDVTLQPAAIPHVGLCRAAGGPLRAVRVHAQRGAVAAGRCPVEAGSADDRYLPPHRHAAPSGSIRDARLTAPVRRLGRTTTQTAGVPEFSNGWRLQSDGTDLVVGYADCALVGRRPSGNRVGLTIHECE